MSEVATRMRSERRVWAVPGSHHDKVVRLALYLLPVGVGVLAVVLLFFPAFFGGDVSFLLDPHGVDVAKERLRIQSAEYRGQDLKGRPFTLTAGSAVQKSSAEPVVQLQNLSAAIKLVNLFITPRIDYVINPAVSILLEGLVMFCAVVTLSRRNKPILNILVAPAATSLCWRGLYLLYLLVAPAWIRDVSVLGAPRLLLNFLLVETAGNAVLIAAGAFVYYMVQRTQKAKTKAGFRVPAWVFGGISVAVLGLSVFLQWAL